MQDSTITHLPGNPIGELKQLMDSETQTKFSALMAACNVKGDFKMVYCSEANSNTISTTLNDALHNSVAQSFTWHTPNSGNFWQGVYGRGWFIIGISNTMDSGVTETFADLSVVGDPNGYGYDGKADNRVVL